MAIELRQMMWMLFKEVGVTIVQDTITNGGLKLRRDRLPDSPIPSALTSTAGCPVCEVHAEIAEGNGYLERLAERAQALGDVPPEGPTTAAMARRSFEKAQEQLAIVAARDGSLRLQAVTLQGQLASLTTRLSGPIAHRDLTEIAGEAHDAWRASAELLEAALLANLPASPAEALKNDPLYKWMMRVRDGEVEPDQAVAELNDLLAKAPAHG